MHCLFVFLLIAILGCGGCGQSKEFDEQYEYDTVSEVEIELPYTAPNAIVNDMSLAVVEDVTYYFEAGMDEAEKNRVINLQRQILHELGKAEETLTGYVFLSNEEYSGFSNNRKDFYITISDIGTVRQIEITLKGLYGNYVHHGLVHGLSVAVAEELGWIEDEACALELAAYFGSKENREQLQLTAPCFSENYYTKEQIAYSEELAEGLAEYIIKEYGTEKIMELLSMEYAACYEKLQDIENEYLEKIGCLEAVDFEGTTYGFGFYNELIFLSCETEHAEYYLHESFEEAAYVEEYPEFTSEYGELKEMLHQLEEEYSTLEKEYLRTERPKVKINFMEYQDMNSEGQTAYAETNGMSSDKIRVRKLSIVLHEYAHHLVHDMTDNDMIIRALETRSIYKRQYQKYLFETKYTIALDRAEQFAGRPLDFLNEFDFSCDIIAYQTKYSDAEFEKILCAGDPVLSTSFFSWLEDIATGDIYLLLEDYNNIPKCTPYDTVLEAVSAWRTYLEEAYGKTSE